MKLLRNPSKDPPRQSPGRPSPTSLWTLQRSDQAVLALAAGMALAAIATVGGYQWLCGQPQADIDRAAPIEYQFAVDINVAEWPELAAVPGVGETLARRIVTHRTVHGPFVDHQQLIDVTGVGPKTLEKLRPYLLPLAPAHNMAGEPPDSGAM